MTLQGSKHVANLYKKLMCLTCIVLLFLTAVYSFTTIHCYVPCRVGPSTADLRCITVATHASFLYLVPC